MMLNGFQKKKSNNDMESDHVVLIDSNNNELEIFWWSHEVILLAKNCEKYEFFKEQNPQIYNILVKLARQIKVENDNVGGKFVKGNSFTWHNMSRAWDRPLEDEAGFVAQLNDDSIRINFTPAVEKSKYKKINSEYFISMGGPDGYVEPYQSISNLFANVLNKLLVTIPYTEDVAGQDNNPDRII